MTQHSSQPAGRPLRRLLFVAITVALPVLFFALAEAALRLGGYGRQEPLFIADVRHPELRLPNPDVIRRYFPGGNAPALRIETGYFRAQKPPGALRIVVQGGSSAAGFPYGYGASLAGMLEQRLRRAWPNREIEVINTALSAVNSYTLLDFADEIAAIEPDAVLVYAGHNEYLGIFGVGSALLGGRSPAATRAYLAVRELRLFRLLEEGYLRLVQPRATPPAPDQAGITLMSRIAADRQIPFGSARYRAGVEQYRHNLSALVERYRRDQIPVYVATLVANERDLEPFVSGLDDGTDAQAWRAQRDAAEARLRNAKPDAVASARALVASDERSADAWFLLGRAYEQSRDYDAAREAYQAARDRDELRFRAPGEFNAIVRDATLVGARLVDVDARLREESTQSILGDELLLEHVHPNLRGYFLLADSFHDALVADGLLGAASAAVDEAQAWREVPVSEVDRQFGAYKVALIKANWPFTDAPAEPRLPDPDSVPALLARELYNRRIDWTTAHARLAAHYRSVGDDIEYTRVVLILADAFPFRATLLQQAGVALITAGRYRQAVRYLYRAAQLEPRDAAILLALGDALLRDGAREQAAAVYERLLAIEPGNEAAQTRLRGLQGVTPRRR